MSSERFRPGRMPLQRPGKEGGARARNRAERTRAICEAALRVFLDKGVESATVDDITASAGVAKGSFYRYFDDKTQLVEALFAPLVAQLDGAVETCQQALSEAREPAALLPAYQMFGSALVAALGGSQDLVRLYLQECRAPAKGARAPIRRLSARITEAAVSLTDAAHTHGMLKPLPPRVTALAVVGAIEGLLASYLEGMDLGETNEITSAVITMMLEGVAR